MTANEGSRLLALLDKPEELAKALENMAWHMTTKFRFNPEDRRDAVQEAVIGGLQSVQEYGENFEKILAYRMRSRIIDHMRKLTRETPSGLHVGGADLYEQHIEERAAEKVDAARKVADIFEDDRITDRQKEVMRVLMLNGFDRSRAARELNMNMQSVTNVLTRVRQILSEDALAEENAKALALRNERVEGSTEGTPGEGREAL